MSRKVGWVISIVVLLAVSALSLISGFSDLDVATTPLQKSVTFGGLLHGVVGLAAGIALIRRVPAARWLTLLWTAIVTYVAATASIAYGGEQATLVGAIAGGAAVALIGLAIYWSARSVTRQPNATVGARTEAVR